MDTVAFYRQCIAKVLSTDKASVVDALNKNGFSVSYSVLNEDLITATVNALLISNSFKEAFNALIMKDCPNELAAFAASSKTNFAGQPEVMYIRNMNNLETNVSSVNHGFLPNNIFENKSPRTIFSADGTSSTTTDIFGVLSAAASTYTGYVTTAASQASSAAAIQLEQLAVAAQQATANAANATSAGVVATIQAYEMPIIIIGALVIAGIGAYYYFKKKKI